ncbi:hypothetical protein ACVGWX_00885, partial [Enterobacter hormaechei]
GIVRPVVPGGGVPLSGRQERGRGVIGTPQPTKKKRRTGPFFNASVFGYFLIFLWLKTTTQTLSTVSLKKNTQAHNICGGRKTWSPQK